MGDFKKFGGSGSGGRSGFKKFGDRPSFDGPRTMHKATCADCGQTCEVPFRPTGDKPVFCSNCFGEKKGGRDFGASKPAFKPAFRGGDRERPMAPRPDRRIDDLKTQLDNLQFKVDKLLEIVSSSHQAKDGGPVKGDEKKEIKSKVVKKVAKKVVAKKK